MDMIIADDSPANISDKIKDLLYSKASERVTSLKPSVSNSIFGSDESEEYFDGEE